MNVLFLSELFYPHGSGAELATYLWARLLADSGFNVRIVTNRFSGESEKDEQNELQILRFPILRAAIGTKYSVLARPDALLRGPIRRLLSWADLVYVPRFWFSAIPVAKACGKIVICHVHDYIPVCPLSTLYDLSRNMICDSRLGCRPSCIVAHEQVHRKDSLEVLGSSFLNLTIWPCAARLIELADAVICVSKAQRELIVRRRASLKRKCHVIYNPLPEISALEVDGDDIGYYGGANPAKGFGVLCSALRSARSGTTIHATGFDVSRSPVEFFGNSRVLFYRRLPGRHFRHIYRRVHAVVVPSVWQEPAPYVVSEAMLLGRLVIASRTGGIPEQVSGCPGAFLFEAGDSEHLGKLIDHVGTLDKQTQAELGAKNREWVLKKFQQEVALHSFIQVLDRMATPHG